MRTRASSSVLSPSPYVAGRPTRQSWFACSADRGRRTRPTPRTSSSKSSTGAVRRALNAPGAATSPSRAASTSWEVVTALSPQRAPGPAGWLMTALSLGVPVATSARQSPLGERSAASVGAWRGGGERQRSGGQEERSDISGNPTAAGPEVEGRRPGRDGSPCPTMPGRTEVQVRPGQQLDREKEESRAAFPATAGIAIGTNSGRSPGHPCGAYLLTVAFGAPIARYRSDLVTSPAEKDSGSSAPPAHSR